MFEDPGERADVVAAYDHLEDVIVFNPENAAWSDMRRFMKDLKAFFSTGHPQHIVRHEIGHAAHYSALSPQERGRIWFAESLGPEELPIARKVSGRSAWSPKEFVAEVFAGLWGGVVYDEEVHSLFSHYRGPWP